MAGGVKINKTKATHSRIMVYQCFYTCESRIDVNYSIINVDVSLKSIQLG